MNNLQSMPSTRDIIPKKCNRFSKEDKARLIASVRARRLLWDMEDSEHNDQISIKVAWTSVATELGRDPQECRVAWRSLRQSYRYHCKTANSCPDTEEPEVEGEPDPLETPNIHWEFAEDMSFLHQLQRKKNVELDQVHLEDSSINTVEEDCSEYVDTEYLEINNDDDGGANDDEMLLKDTSQLSMEEVFCRTCAQLVNPLNALNLFEPENEIFLWQIKELTDLMLGRDELFSDFICSPCQLNLEIATEFRRVCIESQDHTLVKICVKEENEHSETEPSPDSLIAHSPSNTDFALEDERLEEGDITEDDHYYEEANAQTVPSAPSPPQKRRKKGATSQKCQCHQCGLTFTSQDLLKMHMHEIHDMQLHTRFVCKHCGHDFKYSAPLVEHLKSIGVYFGYKCEECDQNFHSRHFLKKHMRRVHGQVDEHICHMCGKNFTTGFNLRNHIVRHSGTRPHKCKLCSAAFSTTAELNNHKRTHDNVRPYPCRYGCGKSFRHCSNRSTHERVHMAGNLRPFQCDYCDKTFVTKGDCRAHQTIHTMSRDFSCDICEQSFKLHKHYLQHLTTKSHKKVEEYKKSLATTESEATSL